MKVTDQLHQSALARQVEHLRTAYQDRDIDRLLTLFADDAELSAAPGTFRGKAAVRQFFEWDAQVSPTALIRDTGLGVLIAGRTVVWERQILETTEGVPFQEEAVTILEFDDAGLIQRYRSYYDKLQVMEQITAGLPGLYGCFARGLVGYLVGLGKKGLPTPPA